VYYIYIQEAPLIVEIIKHPKCKHSLINKSLEKNLICIRSTLFYCCKKIITLEKTSKCCMSFRFIHKLKLKHQSIIAVLTHCNENSRRKQIKGKSSGIWLYILSMAKLAQFNLCGQEHKTCHDPRDHARKPEKTRGQVPLP